MHIQKYPHESLEQTCKICEAKYMLLNDGIHDAEKMYPTKFRLKLKLKICEYTHDGYCSDSGDTILDASDTKEFFPFLFNDLPITVHDNELVGECVIIGDADTIARKWYRPSDRIHGYCNAPGVTYRVIKAKFVILNKFKSENISGALPFDMGDGEFIDVVNGVMIG